MALGYGLKNGIPLVPRNAAALLNMKCWKAISYSASVSDRKPVVS